MTADDQQRMPPPPAHPDLDVLADLHADALPDASTTERVAAHVAHCPQCRSVLAALDAVRSDLSSLPAPPMPSRVAARLDATLADLRRGDLDAPPRRAFDLGATPARLTPVPPAAPEPRTPGPRPADLAFERRRRQRRLKNALTAAAAAVVVLGGGASVATLVRTGTSNSNDSSTASGGGGGTNGEANAPAASADSGLGVGIPSYTKETLRSSLPEIAQRSAVSIITGRGETGPAGVMADTARRTACAGTIRGTHGVLQAVQRIRYEGSMAYVFVFSDGGQRTAYVVPDDCGTSTSLPAAVLDTVS